MKRVRLAIGSLLLGTAGLAAATWSMPAQAEAPIQVGWWNALSGGGQSAPEPTAPAGGLHLSAQPGQITAFGAVLYPLAAGATATLELAVTGATGTPEINPNAPSTASAINIQACPTKDLSWKGGDDQSWDTAPQYDCTRSLVGTLSADGKTLTFLADSSVETVPGELSLAILPVTTNAAPGVGTALPVDTTQPFVVDIAKPEVTSLTVTSTAPVPVPVDQGGQTGGTQPGGTDTGSTGAAGGGGSPTGGGAVPPTLTGPGAGTTTGPSGGDTAPVVASDAAAPNAAPAAAVLPKKSDTAHNVALALLVLIGLGMLATSNGQLPRSPRLLGGAARHAAAYPTEPGTGTGAEAAAVAVPAGPALFGNRGLGRFAKPRTEAPRPLT